MSILIDKDSRVLVQGITGREGLFHASQMMDYGTQVVAGVTPGEGGDWVLDGKVPVFDTVERALAATGANCTVVFVPAKFAGDAMLEAADAGVPLIVCIAEGVPIQDMMKIRKYLDQEGVRLVGPNCPGLLTPGESKVGIIPGHIADPGSVGWFLVLEPSPTKSCTRSSSTAWECQLAWASEAIRLTGPGSRTRCRCLKTITIPKQLS